MRVFPAHQESEESPLQIFRSRTEKGARNGKSTAGPAFGHRSGLDDLQVPPKDIFHN